MFGKITYRISIWSYNFLVFKTQNTSLDTVLKKKGVGPKSRIRINRNFKFKTQGFAELHAKSLYSWIYSFPGEMSIGINYSSKGQRVFRTPAQYNLKYSFSLSQCKCMVVLLSKSILRQRSVGSHFTKWEILPKWHSQASNVQKPCSQVHWLQGMQHRVIKNGVDQEMPRFTVYLLQTIYVIGQKHKHAEIVVFVWNPHEFGLQVL